MLKDQISFQNRINGYVTRGTCSMAQILSTLRKLERMAKATLDNSDEEIRHVVYAVRYMPGECRKETEYRFYLAPMTEEVFEERTQYIKNARIYALHR